MYRKQLVPEHLEIQWPGAGLDNVALRVPGLLKTIVASVSTGGIDELLVTLTGWSEREDRALSYAYERSQEFEAVRIDRGHSLQPMVNPNAPDYDRLTSLWMATAVGRDVEAFHEALHRNQLWSYRQGLLRRGVHLSESFNTASVDRDGARLL